MYIPRLRKISQVIELMRKNDKNTVVTYNLIDKLIKTKQIGAVRFGLDWIINLDEVYAYFTKKEKE